MSAVLTTELSPEHYHDANELERQLFGACILAPTQLDQVAELVGPHCFHDSNLGAAFGLLVDLHAAGKPVSDPTLLVRELRQAGLLELIGGAGFIAKAANQALAYHAQWYAVHVREYWQRRELQTVLTRGAFQLLKGQTNAAEVAELVESHLQAVQHESGADVQTLEVMLSDAVSKVHDAQRLGLTLGLSTGLEILDRETGGFFPGELTILAARPSIGKSALAVELAARIAEPRANQPSRRVLFVSLEMSAEQIAHRFLNRATGIPVRRIQSATLNANDLTQLEQARTHLRGMGLKAFVSSRASLARIRARARVLAAQEGLDLLVVDYLGLIQSDGRQTSYERITAISRELKQLALELNKPVLCLAQLNRAAAQAGGPPTLEHLRDSGAIEQDADNVWLLHRENREAIQASLIVAKQRQGAVGTIELEFDAERMSFDVPKIRYTEWSPKGN